MPGTSRALLLSITALVAFYLRDAPLLADTVYVSNYFSGTIVTYDSAGHATLFASGLSYPTAMAFDSSNNLYVANDLDQIVKFDPSGHESLFASSLGSGLHEPYGLAFDNSNNLYMADAFIGQIDKFTPNGQESFFAGVGMCWGLAFDGRNNLYVSLDAGSIDKIDLAGNVSFFASGLTNPRGIAFDNSGNLWVANLGGDQGNLVEFSPSGNKSIFNNAALFDPFGLAFDSSGNAFVANYADGTIQKIDPNGNESTFASGLQIPRFVTVQVPEPSTWAMVALGIGVVLGGRRLRLRRRSS